MNVTINGKSHEVSEISTLATALEQTGMPRQGVAVAVDGAVVPRDAWERTQLTADSVVEVLTAVQGG